MSTPPTPTPCHRAAPTEHSKVTTTASMLQATIARSILKFTVVTSLFQTVFYLAGYVPLCETYPLLVVAVLSGVLLRLVGGGWLPFLGFFCGVLRVCLCCGGAGDEAGYGGGLAVV
ncbi:uncharacterized protein H6S33_007106 [Morchella sextelata]|uniref:uncharacterized protein n=1 Tax=Morchella sextelata TaxID=1174677 RepID=UPI001D050DBE|nr:uncharacterized protein H6S33_007106 [Morchella sextelata]KAH0604075.1 hypothetical protein H6S33_007106 [Morchella sextelata]